MTDLSMVSAIQLVDGYRSGEFTPEDAARAALDAIRVHDGDVNAFVLLDEQAALAAGGGVDATLPYTYPFTMTQQPALSLPCGRTAGRRPIGLQVVGPRHADALVLRAGRTYERATEWHTATPSLLG
jgi:Asp-tRNA(Asn)/Glu-tRNA(Gln) amidotransferase A subunit family amidase